MIAALLMAGGRGERFWPKSRKSRPKQLLPITSNKTMIEETIDRISPRIPLSHIFISTGADLVSPIREILPTLPEGNIIVEPVARNTAPCIGLSTLFIKRTLGNVPIIVLPADHIIPDQELFLKTVDYGAKLAVEKKSIITIGIRPRSAHTGYGYIQHGELVHEDGEFQSFTLNGFTEKPDLDTAREFLDAGNFLWNSGMFLWTCDTILTEIAQYMPELSALLNEIDGAIGTKNEGAVIESLFPKSENISIDYGIMEQTKVGLVINGTFDWDDVGGWLAMEKFLEKDDSGNSFMGMFESIDTHNCIALGGKQLLTTIGVNDLIIVSTDDALLICDRSRAEDIKKLLGKLKERSDTRFFLE